MHIKVSPIERVHQDNSKDTNLTRTRPNPTTENASEIAKTRLFTMPAGIKEDSENTFMHLAL